MEQLPSPERALAELLPRVFDREMTCRVVATFGYWSLPLHGAPEGQALGAAFEWMTPEEERRVFDDDARL